MSRTQSLLDVVFVDAQLLGSQLLDALLGQWLECYRSAPGIPAERRGLQVLGESLPCVKVLHADLACRAIHTHVWCVVEWMCLGQVLDHACPGRTMVVTLVAHVALGGVGGRGM